MSKFKHSPPREAAAPVTYAAAVTERRFLSVEEFCQQTGLSAATVWRRLKDGSLPSYQPGGKGTRVLIPLAALVTTTIPVEPDVPARPLVRRPRSRPRWQDDAPLAVSPRNPDA